MRLKICERDMSLKANCDDFIPERYVIGPTIVFVFPADIAISHRSSFQKVHWCDFDVLLPRSTMAPLLMLNAIRDNVVGVH